MLHITPSGSILKQSLRPCLNVFVLSIYQSAVHVCFHCIAGPLVIRMPHLGKGSAIQPLSYTRVLAKPPMSPLSVM